VVFRGCIIYELSAHARISAETFVATRDGLGLLPTSQYLQIILDGAREHELPSNFHA